MRGKLIIALIVLSAIAAVGYILYKGDYISLSSGGGVSPEKASTLKLGKQIKGTIKDANAPHWYKVEIPQGKTLYISGFDIEDAYLKVDGKLYGNHAQTIVKSADANYQELQFTNNTTHTEFLLRLEVEQDKTHKKYSLFANIVDEPVVRPEN
ncbi:MAG: hypothetical protein JW783_08630 [Bacteroidales bacterium]|nr:hypothetical protein [Bacteroidales bacterium]MBN2748878.1 hypothetical protein [Bacteroidales bacterium]